MKTYGDRNPFYIPPKEGGVQIFASVKAVKFFSKYHATDTNIAKAISDIAFFASYEISAQFANVPRSKGECYGNAYFEERATWLFTDGLAAIVQIAVKTHWACKQVAQLPAIA